MIIKKKRYSIMFIFLINCLMIIFSSYYKIKLKLTHDSAKFKKIIFILSIKVTS